MADALRVAIVGARAPARPPSPRSSLPAWRRTPPARAWVPELLREWCDEFGRTPLAHEQAAILRAQHERIERRAVHDVVVCDTTALMTAVYSRLVFGDRSLDAPALALHGRMALTLLTRGPAWVPTATSARRACARAGRCAAAGAAPGPPHALGRGRRRRAGPLAAGDACRAASAELQTPNATVITPRPARARPSTRQRSSLHRHAGRRLVTLRGEHLAHVDGVEAVLRAAEVAAHLDQPTLGDQASLSSRPRLRSMARTRSLEQVHAKRGTRGAKPVTFSCQNSGASTCSPAA